jgi:hypothetical protein
MKRLARLVGLAILGLVSSAAFAAPTPSAAPSVSPLTVTGDRPIPNPSPTEAIQSYIHDHAVVTRTDRLARWDGPICPVTFGGPEPDNAFVTARIKAVATAVGARVDPSAKCRANVEVIFSNYPQQLINLIYKRHPLFVGYHYQAQTKALLTFDRPIKSWYATGTTSSALGQAGGVSTGAPGSDVGPGEAVLDETWAESPAGSAGSRLDDSLTAELMNVLIIVDQKQVAGDTIGEIADYVSLMALSQPPTLAACGALDSILDLFSPACRTNQKPTALTASDTAYLTALYAANLSLAKGFSESQIVTLMRQRRPQSAEIAPLR